MKRLLLIFITPFLLFPACGEMLDDVCEGEKTATSTFEVRKSLTSCDGYGEDFDGCYSDAVREMRFARSNREWNNANRKKNNATSLMALRAATDIHNY